MDPPYGQVIGVFIEILQGASISPVRTPSGPSFSALAMGDALASPPLPSTSFGLEIGLFEGSELGTFVCDSELGSQI